MRRLLTSIAVLSLVTTFALGVGMSSAAAQGQSDTARNCRALAETGQEIGECIRQTASRDIDISFGPYSPGFCSVIIEIKRFEPNTTYQAEHRLNGNTIGHYYVTTDDRGNGTYTVGGYGAGADLTVIIDGLVSGTIEVAC